MKILIAEDDFSSRIALTAIMTKNGHEMLATVNGTEAWRIMHQADAPSLAILD